MKIIVIAFVYEVMRLAYELLFVLQDEGLNIYCKLSLEKHVNCMRVPEISCNEFREFYNFSLGY